MAGMTECVPTHPTGQCLSLTKPQYTCVCPLVDKEEIGSVGATGMHSRFFENAVAEIMDAAGDYSELKVRRALQSSRMLSSDVSAALRSELSGRHGKENSAFFGKGLTFNKFYRFQRKIRFQRCKCRIHRKNPQDPLMKMRRLSRQPSLKS